MDIPICNVVRDEVGDSRHRNSVVTDCQVRQATIADVPSLRALIECSVRELQASDYTPVQIEASLCTVFSIDTKLIEDGTYFIAEMNREMVGCGGWSRRKTLCGGDHHSVRNNDLMDPSRDAAKIRAIFVHPRWARRGIGSLLLKVAEDAATSAGFTRLEMGATLTGVPLYLLKGYRAIEQIDVPLEADVSLPVVRMEKAVEQRRIKDRSQ